MKTTFKNLMAHAILGLALTLGLGLAITGCGGSDNKPFAPINISFDRTNAGVPVGESFQLSPAIWPRHLNTDRNVTWSSDAPSIASVDENGVVVGISPGRANVRATTSGGLAATCRVSVVELNWDPGIDVILAATYQNRASVWVNGEQTFLAGEGSTIGRRNGCKPVEIGRAHV
jgi:uncharacterized protein YjdB